MVFGLPAIGETSWGQKILDSINAVKTTADEALPAAEKNAASGVAPLDGDSLVPQANLPAHLTEAELSATFVGRDGDHSAAGPYMEYSTLGAGAVLHLLAGVGSTAPYVLGVGVDHDSSPTGVYASVKGDNSTGIGATLETTSGSGSEGFMGQSFASGKLVRLIAGDTASGDLIAVENVFGGTSKVMTWDTLGNDGQIGSDGNVMLTGATSEVAVQHATTLQNRARLRVTTGATLLDLDHYAGSSLWFAHRIDTSANSLRIRKGTAATALGAATYTTMLEFKDSNAIGFFGATPVTKRAATADASDLATAITLVNALKADLVAYGLKVA